MEARSISMPPYFSGRKTAVSPNSADLRRARFTTSKSCLWIASKCGSTSLRQNSSVVFAMALCSSVKSSGVKTSADGCASRRKNPPPGILTCPFEDSRRALSAADAHRDHAVARLPAAHFAKNGRRQLCAGASQRMAEGDSAAIDVHDFQIQPRFANYRQRLHRERFIQLNHADVGEF